MGNVILQLSWITNAGYVYASLAWRSCPLNSRIKKALALATTINGREDIYNALERFGSGVGRGAANWRRRKYSDDAVAIAREDNTG